MHEHPTWYGPISELALRAPDLETGIDSQRVLDLLLTLLILPVAFPLGLLAGLAVILDSRGPMLFRQTRIGRRGRPFTLYKLRSMQSNADPALHRAHVRELLHTNGGTQAWRRMDRDPRVTRVGHRLRLSGLDELPQLYNVLRGEMSLVGPRPALPYEQADWQDWHFGRLTHRPGITGLWQVAGRDRVDFDGMVELDLEYLRRRSVGLDLLILARTPMALLARRSR